MTFGRRIFVTDPKTQITFLVDSGAKVSLVPKTLETRPDPRVVLTAANNTKIRTFGSRILQLSLNLRRDLTYPFLIAEVDHAIIGADFLDHFGLVLDFKNRRIIDSLTKFTTKGLFAIVRWFPRSWRVSKTGSRKF